jgi:beta-ureidopropionase
MSTRVVKCGLIQLSNPIVPSVDPDKLSEAEQRAEVLKIRDAMIDKHIPYIEKAGEQGVQILCLQEIFAGPYFCAEVHKRWYHLAERVPEGHTTRLLQKYATKYNMAIINPIYEEAMTGVYYNSAVMIDGQGEVLGTYRKNHIPDIPPAFSEKFYFKPGNLGYPVWDLGFAKVGIYICYDRHFPEGARLLGLNGAEIIFNPSATITGVSKYLWELEQPAHAVANGYFVGAINRVGTEEPWKHGKFYGSSYFCNPRGQIVAQASEDDDELVIADLDFDMVREVRNAWQFYRDRRPETYEDMCRLLP